MRALVSGGIRSGKSRYALERARSLFPGEPKGFIATAEACDEQMKTRIVRHQKERGSDFVTIEEPIDLGEAIRRAQEKFPVIVIDCLTFWINNLLFHFPAEPAQIDRRIHSFLKALETCNENSAVFMVTNEVGWGIVENDPLNRNFVDRLGGLNQEAARVCEELVLVVAGIPARIKGGMEVAKLDL